MNENVNGIIEELKTEIHLAEYVEADYKDNVPVDLLRNALAIITEQKRKLDKIADIIFREKRCFRRTGIRFALRTA